MQIYPKAQWLGFGLFAFSLGLLLGVFYLAQTPLVVEEVSLDQEEASRLPGDGEVPDFNSFDQVQDKKRAFFTFLTPMIEAENRSIQRQRQALLQIYSEYQQHSSLSRQSEKRLLRLQKQYRLDDDSLETDEVLNTLLLRVDEVPVSMALAQAAIESAWGTSRFALVANNYFGQWCFKKGCGVVPSSRPSGEYHEVAKFKTVQASVASYIRNINTHNAYRPLRVKRASLRDQGRPVSSLLLIEELDRYSERGEEYIEELQQIISVNQLTELEVHSDSV